MLADEPTGNLDTKNSDAVLDMLVRSNRELGQTTLMITHNPEAAAVAGRILYMRDGQMVREEKGAGRPTSRGLTRFGPPGILKVALQVVSSECSTPASAAKWRIPKGNSSHIPRKLKVELESRSKRE